MIGDSLCESTKPDTPDHASYFDGVCLCYAQFPSDNDPVIPDDIAVFEKRITDQCTYEELNLSQGVLLHKAKAVSRPKDGNDQIMDLCDPNPFLNNLIYYVKFPDSKIKEHSANITSENMHAQVNDDSYVMKYWE